MTLIESTKREYEILREFSQAVASVKSKNKIKYEHRFIDEIKNSLMNTLIPHFDKNNLKQKYYYLRRKQANTCQKCESFDPIAAKDYGFCELYKVSKDKNGYCDLFESKKESQE